MNDRVSGPPTSTAGSAERACARASSFLPIWRKMHQAFEAMLARRAGESAKLIEAETVEVVPSLPAPDVFADRPAKAAADNGAKECKPRKRGPRPPEGLSVTRALAPGS